ncbi:uncharacterized protein [Salminus brasiliensis]|uniref:uncharacterized protein isoform X2 n=1 Tax=Salminus brasiliensis TaxID=930266 RepID=UPI003B8358E7
MDAVPQPKVTCVKNEEGEVSLECSLDPDVTAEFEWTGPDNMIKTGKTIQISTKTDHYSVYFCIAKNPVSRKSEEFHLKTCYPGHVCGTEYVETGKDYTFTPIVTGVKETILWKFRNNRVVEFEFKDTTWYRFKDRGHLDTETGKLTLMNMMKSESGLYQSEIQVNGKLHNTAHDLVVMDAVPQPKVTCVKNEEGEVSLECSLDPDVTAEFEWTGPDNMIKTGKTIQISTKTDHNSIYFCIAKNPVSSKSEKFHLKTCYPDDHIAIAVAVTVGLIVTVVTIVAVVLYLRKRGILKINGAVNSTEANGDLEAGTPLMATNTSPPESNSTHKVDEKSPESSCKTGNTENNQSSEKVQDSCKAKPESISKENKEQEDGDDSMDEAPNGSPKVPKSAELNHETSQDAVPTVLKETQFECKISATESKGGDEHKENINNVKSEDQIDSVDLENQGSGENGEAGDEHKENINNVKSEDQIDSVDLENQGSGENGEAGDEDEVNINNLKSEDQIVSVNLENQGSGENGEDLDQNQDTSELPDFSTPVVVAARKVEATIAKFEDLAWKPKELTSRDAGQKSDI